MDNVAIKAFEKKRDCNQKAEVIVIDSGGHEIKQLNRLFTPQSVLELSLSPEGNTGVWRKCRTQCLSCTLLGTSLIVIEVVLPALPARLTCCSIFSKQRHIQEFITINNPVILIPCSSKKSGRGRKFSSTSSLPLLFILLYIDDFFSLGINHSPFVRDVRSDRIPKQAEGQVPPTPSLKRRSKLWDGSPPRKFARL